MLDKIKWFWSFYKHQKYVLFVLLVLTPINTLFLATIPRMIGFTVDFLESGKLPDNFLAQKIIEVGGLFGVSQVESFGYAYIVLGLAGTMLYAFVQSHRAWMNLKIEWLARQRAFDHITDRGPDFFLKFRTGDLVTRMTDDVAEKLSWFACSGIFRLYEAVLIASFIIIQMVSIDPMMTLYSTGTLPLLILIFFRTSSLLDKRYEALQGKISSFNDTVEACFSSIRVVKAYVRETAQQGKFDVTARARRQAEIDSIRVTTVVDSFYNYVYQFGIVVVLLVGGLMLIDGNLTHGDLAVFIYYVVWLVFPMFDIGQFLVKARQSSVSINRLNELEATPPMVFDNGTQTVDKVESGDIKFENVSFAFPESERKILDQVSLSVPSGATVAVVGRVGSGKSWLLQMIPRLVDPTDGSISLDGRDLRDYSLEQLRGRIGYVPQEPVLFSDTVRNNILLGRDKISDTLLEWGIEVAQLSNEIKGFANGLNTSIGTRGMSISGGQKQRLALARALVGKPEILILDDCTSALDSRTEAALWDKLHEVLPGLTAVLVTHRPDTLERVDKIFVLEEGHLIEEGSHAELMALEGQYFRTYRRYRLAEEVNA